jgi:hypothetical protein
MAAPIASKRILDCVDQLVCKSEKGGFVSPVYSKVTQVHVHTSGKTTGKAVCKDGIKRMVTFKKIGSSSQGAWVY